MHLSGGSSLIRRELSCGHSLRRRRHGRRAYACSTSSSDDQVITDQENPAKKPVRTCCSNSRVLGSISCFYTYLRVSTRTLLFTQTVTCTLCVYSCTRSSKKRRTLSIRPQAGQRCFRRCKPNRRAHDRPRARAVRPRFAAARVGRVASRSLSLLSRARPWSETSSASRRRPSSTAGSPPPSTASRPRGRAFADPCPAPPRPPAPSPTPSPGSWPARGCG